MVRPRLLTLLLLALLVSVVAPAGAQTVNTCADGIDNDGDGVVDGADDNCVEDASTEPVYVIDEQPYPLAVVVIRGSRRPGGAVKVTKLSVRAVRGSVARIRCFGRRCPRRAVRRTVGRRQLRVRAFQRVLRPQTILEIRVARPGQRGKYVRFAVRRGKQPLRRDGCTRPGGRNPVACF